MDDEDDIKNFVEKEQNYEEMDIDQLLKELENLKNKLNYIQNLLKKKKIGQNQADKIFKK